MWVGDGHCCSPQSVSGQDYQWFGAVGGEMGKVRGGRRVLGQAMP